MELLLRILMIFKKKILLKYIILLYQKEQYKFMTKLGKPVSQRQLRVGEMIKQSLGMIFLKNEAKVPNLETNKITVTEVKLSQDLKVAKAFVLPLGGENADEAVNILREFSTN